MPQPAKLTPQMVFAACFTLKEAGEVINPYRVWLHCGKVGSTSTAKKPVEAWRACERGEEVEDPWFRQLYDSLQSGTDGAEQALPQQKLPVEFLQIVDGLTSQVWQYVAATIDAEVAEANEQAAAVVEEALGREKAAVDEGKRVAQEMLALWDELKALQSRYATLERQHEALKVSSAEASKLAAERLAHIERLEAEVAALSERCGKSDERAKLLGDRIRGLVQDNTLLYEKLLEREARAATAEEKARQLEKKLGELQVKVLGVDRLKKDND